MTAAVLQEVVAGVTDAVSEFWGAKIIALEQEIKELKAREPLVGPMGPAGPQGERGEKGLDGRDGLDSTVPGPEGPMGPRGERGPAGTDGKDGRDGIDGKDGSVGPEGAKGLDGAQGPEGPMGPIGPQGRDGDPGVQGEKGIDGSQGERGPEGPQGIAGRDGTGLVGALIDRDNHLIFTLSDGTTKDIGIVVGPQGIPGEKGADGLPGANGKDGINGRDGTPDAIAVKKLDYRTIQFVRKDNGEPVEGGTVKLDNVPMFPDPAYPVFKRDFDYNVCDLASWGGNVYYAKIAGCGIVPGDGSSMSEMMWGLFSKRGNMGKTGLTGPQGPVGKQGEKGDRGPERW